MEYTYQDYLEVLETNSETQLIQFVLNAIHEHKRSEKYEIAVIADEYFRHLNRTILDYQKLLYTVTGKAVPDNYSANYKLSSNFFFQFVTGLNQYLLSNGVSWGNPSTEKRVGKNFDKQLQYAGERALVGSVSFGFMNYDHLEVFGYTEFKPMYDEDNGALCAGIRFWQISNQKPLHAILYDSDGYMHFVWKDGVGTIREPKTPYKITARKTDVGGVENFDGANYPTFPIVPFFGINKQSELVGRREQIDCYDLIKSGFANTVDEASLIYWTITGAAGMRDTDLVKFVERIKTVHAAAMGEGQSAEAHSVEMPYASRETLLDRLRNDLYDDFMAADTRNVASGSVVTAQIEATFHNLDLKANLYEFNVLDFIDGILKVLGIDDEATFTRSKIINQQEQVSVILSASDHLDDEYVTRKILDVLGDGDQADDVLKRRDAEDMARISVSDDEQQEQQKEDDAKRLEKEAARYKELRFG